MPYEKGITKFKVPRDMSFTNEDKEVIYKIKKGDTLTYDGIQCHGEGSIGVCFEEVEGSYQDYFLLDKNGRGPAVAWEDSYGALISEYLNHVSGTYNYGKDALDRIEEMIYTRLEEGKSFESVKENLGTLFDAISMS